MIKGRLLSSRSEKTTREKIIEEKSSVMERIVKEFEEISCKLDKTRYILHTAGDIEVGNTPHEILDETKAYTLLHYRPLVSKVAKTPLLVVYALINKSYILDLQPDKSWIRNLLRQGFDIYLVDWKAPTNVDKFTSFDDFINCYMDDCLEI